MNLGQMKADVQIALGNMKSSSPWVTGGHVLRAINAAQQYVILLALGGNRANLNMFPELETEWQATTAAGFDYVTLPSNRLAVQHAFSFKKTPADPRVDHQTEITVMPYTDLQRMPRPATREGWPTIGAWRARRFYFNPTASIDYLTDLWLIGVKKPDDLALDADLPLIDEEWHPLIVTEAASRVASKMRWFDEQKAWRQQVIEEVGAVTDPKALADFLQDDPIELEFHADQQGVYS